MAQSCRYEMMLGQLGAILIERDARRISIADEGVFLNVSWQCGAAEREHGFFRESELAQIHPSSPSRQTAAANRVALLAALGRQLDQRGLDVAAIEEKTDTFAVSGVASGKYTKQLIDYRELANATHAEAARGRTAAAPAQSIVDDDDDATLTDPNPRFPAALRDPTPLSPLDGTDSPLRRRLRL